MVYWWSGDVVVVVVRDLPGDLELVVPKAPAGQDLGAPKVVDHYLLEKGAGRCRETHHDTVNMSVGATEANARKMNLSHHSVSKVGAEHIGPAG